MSEKFCHISGGFNNIAYYFEYFLDFTFSTGIGGVLKPLLQMSQIWFQSKHKIKNTQFYITVVII